MDKILYVFNFFPSHIQKFFENLKSLELINLNEITFINGCVLLVQIKGRRMYIGTDGTTYIKEKGYMVNSKDIKVIFEAITNSSEYAYARFINEGYITLPYGHRVGIIGNCVMQNEKISKINHINSLCFRIAQCNSSNADLIIEDIFNNGNIQNTLIVSPPGCGKTTLIRALASLISTCSNKIIKKCAIIDERFELAACYNGKSSLGVGDSSVIISGCEKAIAIPLVVRSMSPDVIFTDEVATEDDVNAIKYARLSGCKVIASSHGINEYNNELIPYNANELFDKFIIMSLSSGPGTIEKVV